MARSRSGAQHVSAPCNRNHKHDHQCDSHPPYPIYPPIWYDPFYPGSGAGFFPYEDPYLAEEYYHYGRDRYPDSSQGNVLLQVKPRDVEIYVDGVLTAQDGRATLSLPTGHWRLEIVREGYRTETLEIELAQGVAVRVERRLERIRTGDPEEYRQFPLGDTGELLVDVRPDDAIVYLNGRAIGLTRDIRELAAFRRLAPGRHVVEVRRPGYETLRSEVVVSPVQRAVVRGELKPQ
jgi:hypothetical protein